MIPSGCFGREIIASLKSAGRCWWCDVQESCSLLSQSRGHWGPSAHPRDAHMKGGYCLDMLLPLQKNFLETITRMFTPFGLPSDLLSKCCALVEYESLESARRAFEDLGRQSHPGGESIRVVRLCGKGSKKKPGAKREVVEELRLSWLPCQRAAWPGEGAGGGPTTRHCLPRWW
uniref:RRM domain-containing protein n=1 Tax=Strix occidentalis caurina TaxID=311401 RepID=A0A8D0ES70_STROC